MIKWLDWRPPGGGIAFIAVCFIFASSVFIALGGDSWYTRWVIPCFLPVGVGLWLKHAWARWTSFVFFVLLAAVLVMATIQDGLTVRIIVKALIVASSLFALWEWKVYPDTNESDGEFGRESGLCEPKDAGERG